MGENEKAVSNAECEKCRKLSDQELEMVNGGRGMSQYHADDDCHDPCYFKPISAAVANEPKCKNCTGWDSHSEWCEVLECN